MSKNLHGWTESRRGSASRTLRKRWREDPEYRRNVSRAASRCLKKLRKDPEFCRKHAESASRILKTQWKSPKFRKKTVKAIKRQWKDPKFAKMVMERNLSLGMARPSKSQIKFFRKLKRIGFPNLVLDHPVGRFLLDIADLVKKRAIETDGVYWHSKRHDRKRDRKLKKLGWSILRIPIPFPEGSLEKAKEFLCKR